MNRFVPIGPTGPNSTTCGECHNEPFPSSAGLAHSSVARDPEADGKPPFNVRSVRSLYGDGLMQMLAEEMTEDLQAARDKAAAAAKASPGKPAVGDLVAKGTKFGSIAATATPAGVVTYDVSKVAGVDPDLVVRAMGWKGDATLIRTITAGASFRAMGMQSEEILWKIPEAANTPDFDGDGVVRELSVGDVTGDDGVLGDPADADRARAAGRVSGSCRRPPPNRRR